MRTHPAAGYQKVCVAQRWGVCFVKAYCIHSIHWGLVVGRSAVENKEREKNEAYIVFSDM